jgi:hypothetical protein
MKKKKEKEINRLFNILGWHPEPIESIEDAEEASEGQVEYRQVHKSSCGKSAYTSERAAKQAMRSRLNKGANVSKLRCYKCDDCGMYHMTSSFKR